MTKIARYVLPAFLFAVPAAADELPPPPNWHERQCNEELVGIAANEATLLRFYYEERHITNRDALIDATANDRAVRAIWANYHRTCGDIVGPAVDDAEQMAIYIADRKFGPAR